jgi:hypothetical protein
MSLFALLDFEGEVQVGDKTRLNASKSFASKGAAEITSLTVKPDLNESAIDVFGPANPNDWTLDWVYSGFRFDLDSTNNTFIVDESGTEYTATLTAQSYASLATLCTELQTQLNAASALTYTVSSSDNIVTISATGSFKVVASPLVTMLQFDPDEPTATSQVSTYVGYGQRIISVVASNGSVTSTKYFYINVYSDVGDYLFSSDQDLIAHEPDVMKWVIDGRSSFKDVYRRAQKIIVAWLDEKGFVNQYQEKYTKRDIIDIEEVRQWSTYMSLRLIMNGISNAQDDVFSIKAKQYELLEIGARQRVILRLDTNKDGIADATEGVSIYSGSLFRR